MHNNNTQQKTYTIKYGTHKTNAETKMQHRRHKMIYNQPNNTQHTAQIRCKKYNTAIPTKYKSIMKNITHRTHDKQHNYITQNNTKHTHNNTRMQEMHNI